MAFNPLARPKVYGLAGALLLLLSPSAYAATNNLADAVERQNQSQIERLLAENAAVNATQPDGMTALHWAVYHNQPNLVGELLEAGADPNVRNRYGVTPLSLGCMNAATKIVRQLLAAGADPKATLEGGETLLMTASRTGNVDIVSALLAAGADVNATERNQQTAVMWAAAEGHTDVVLALIDAGADIATPLKNSGYNPFFFAIREGKAETAKALLGLGTDINDVMRPESRNGKYPKRGTSALLLAVENGHFDLAVELLEAGADPNDARSGFTPLHTLTWIRKPDIGESTAGAPKPKGSGKRNSEQFIRELVAHGADVNFQLTSGRKAGGGRVSQIGATPFFMAADRADLAYLKLLLELGADPFIPNVDGTTPLMVAAGIGSTAPEEEAGSESECLAAVEFLVSLGADVNVVDANGETAMHGAAYKNIPAVVNYLNEVGADINLWNTKNKIGWTPLLLAEGYRPGNFKPSFETADAITKVMLSQGVKPPTGPKPKHTNYAN